ncbi:MAG TPA: hypothetical protein VK446_04910 [Methylocystis sp.]|nr:hypothetical protein [Methylocystis sp.]
MSFNTILLERALGAGEDCSIFVTRVNLVIRTTERFRSLLCSGPWRYLEGE